LLLRRNTCSKTCKTISRNLGQTGSSNRRAVTVYCWTNSRRRYQEELFGLSHASSTGSSTIGLWSLRITRTIRRFYCILRCVRRDGQLLMFNAATSFQRGNGAAQLSRPIFQAKWRSWAATLRSCDAKYKPCNELCKKMFNFVKRFGNPDRYQNFVNKRVSSKTLKLLNDRLRLTKQKQKFTYVLVRYLKYFVEVVSSQVLLRLSVDTAMITLENEGQQIRCTPLLNDVRRWAKNQRLFAMEGSSHRNIWQGVCDSADPEVMPISVANQKFQVRCPKSRPCRILVLLPGNVRPCNERCEKNMSNAWWQPVLINHTYNSTHTFSTIHRVCGKYVDQSLLIKPNTIFAAFTVKVKMTRLVFVTQHHTPPRILR